MLQGLPQRQAKPSPSAGSLKKCLQAGFHFHP